MWVSNKEGLSTRPLSLSLPGVVMCFLVPCHSARGALAARGGGLESPEPLRVALRGVPALLPRMGVTSDRWPPNISLKVSRSLGPTLPALTLRSCSFWSRSWVRSNRSAWVGISSTRDKDPSPRMVLGLTYSMAKDLRRACA